MNDGCVLTFLITTLIVSVTSRNGGTEMTTTQPQAPVMTLEETIASLQKERDKAKSGIAHVTKGLAYHEAEGDELSKELCELSLLEWGEILSRTDSALHYLEAGKMDAARLSALRLPVWVDIRNRGEEGRVIIFTPGCREFEGSNIREAIDSMTLQPVEEVKEEPC